MATLNKVMLIGRLTDNPEPPRTLPNSGSQVIKFRFAVGRSRKNPQTGQWENDPNPLYIDCEAFAYPDAKRNRVDVIQRFATKGSQLYIDGRLQLDNWEDKNGGGKRSKHKMVVENVELLDKPGTNAGGGDAGGETGLSEAPPPRSNFGGRGGFGGGGTSNGPPRGPAPKPSPGYSAGPPDDDDGPGGDDKEIPF